MINELREKSENNQSGQRYGVSRNQKDLLEQLNTEQTETYQSGAKKVTGLGRQSKIIDNILSSGSYKDRRYLNHSKGTLSNNDRHVYEDASSIYNRSDFTTQMRPTLQQTESSMPKFDLYQVECSTTKARHSYAAHQGSLIISTLDPDYLENSHDSLSRKKDRLEPKIMNQTRNRGNRTTLGPSRAANKSQTGPRTS